MQAIFIPWPSIYHEDKYKPCCKHLLRLIHLFYNMVTKGECSSLIGWQVSIDGSTPLMQAFACLLGIISDFTSLNAYVGTIYMTVIARLFCF